MHTYIPDLREITMKIVRYFNFPVNFTLFLMITFKSFLGNALNATGTVDQSSITLGAILSSGFIQTNFIDSLQFLNSPVFLNSSLCDSFRPFYKANPTYFPTTTAKLDTYHRNSYYKSAGSGSYGAEADTPSTTHLLLNDALCDRYFIDESALICGDLFISNRLVITTGINGSSALANESMHVQTRCHFSKLFHIGSVVVPTADVYIIGNTHVGGNLIAREVQLDAGAVLQVGIRGMKGTVKALLHEHSPTTGRANNRERAGISGETSFSENAQIRYRLTFSDTQGFTTYYASSDETMEFVNQAYTNNEPVMVQMNCPYLGINGNPVDYSASETKISSVSSTTKGNKSRERLFSSMVRSKASQQHASETSASSEEKLDLPSENRSIGDMTTSHLSLHNGATLIVFGNIHTEEGLVSDGSSAVYSLCGRFFSNLGDGVGIVLLDGSVAAFNGIGHNHMFQIILQHSSSIFMRDVMLISSIVQLNDVSEIICASSLYSSVLAAYETSKIILGGKLDVSSAGEMAGNAFAIIRQDVNISALQLFDGSHMDIFNNLVAQSFIGLDNNAKLTVRGSSMHTGLLHLGNRSSAIINQASLVTVGLVEVFSSFLTVRNGSLEVENNIIFSRVTDVYIGGDIRSKGKMILTDQQNATSVTKDGSSSVEATKASSHSTRGLQNSASSLSSTATKVSSDAAHTLFYNTTPALYVEGTKLIVGGNIFCENAWVEFTQNSLVNVMGNVGVRTTNSSLFLMQGSQLTLNIGNVKVDRVILLSVGSRLLLRKGNLETEYLNLYSMSNLLTENGLVTVKEDFMAEGRSRIRIKGKTFVSGSLLYLDEQSILVTAGLLVSSGDIFVEDRSQLETLSGDVTANGSIICQDAGKIRSNKNVISQQGHVVAENGSELRAKRSIVAANGLVRKTKESTIVSSQKNLEVSVSISFTISLNTRNCTPID
ncbi:hypothetical protein IE077_000871 [Cardiosporidium cionae]|uniref:Uncharacterized protein n=1 Tax=Cardiosporidium cionae TaxID=476202 RepID=A0ABQ7J6C7_9APIC|nr:hypothetical protein IE077_000871 [Cardiosporidium cionae]|eukprot:KAF8819538.1 hypothetical protein IE077_000871 [Cardiosporidium cionae]